MCEDVKAERDKAIPVQNGNWYLMDPSVSISYALLLVVFLVVEHGGGTIRLWSKCAQENN